MQGDAGAPEHSQEQPPSGHSTGAVKLSSDYTNTKLHQTELYLELDNTMHYNCLFVDIKLNVAIILKQ